MALSLDDRLLGEKTHYYCSSSSDEEGEDNADRQASITTEVPDSDVSKYAGHCVNVSSHQGKVPVLFTEGKLQ